MMTTTLWKRLSYGGVIYLAAAVELTQPFAGGPSWLLLVAAWLLCRTRSHEGIVWAMFIGGAIDLLSHHRLGVHLATCGLLAAIARSTLLDTDARPWWCLPVVAAWMSAGDAALSQTALVWLTGAETTPIAIATLAASLGIRAALTAWGLLLLREIARRMWISGRSSTWQLENQWNRLAEQ
jgi:rod shape-determining protein MreD